MFFTEEQDPPSVCTVQLQDDGTKYFITYDDAIKFLKAAKKKAEKKGK